MNLKDLRNHFEQMKGRKLQLDEDLLDAEKRIVKLKKNVRKFEKAAMIIREVGIKTQEQLSYNISEITTTALSAVMSDPYDLEVKFVERRSKTECDILFSRNGREIDPYDGGFGAIDVAAFALRIATWSMQNPKTRNVLILDEPFKHLKGEKANQRMLYMLNQVSKQLNIQIIMVGDERVSREAAIEATDRLFETTLVNDVTQIQVDGN